MMFKQRPVELHSLCAATALAIGLMAMLPTPSAMAKSTGTGRANASKSTSIPKLSIDQGDQHTFAVNGTVTRVATADGGVVSINAALPSGVVLSAIAPGTAMVSVWIEGRNLPVAQYRVTVQPRLPNSREALGADASQVKVESTGTSLRLTGQLSSLEKHQAVVEALGNASSTSAEASAGDGGKAPARTTRVIDQSSSGFDVQVQLDVKVVEVSRGKLKSAGFYADRFSGSATTGISGPSNLSSFTTDAQLGRVIKSTSGFVPKADAFSIFRWGANSLTVFSALEENGFAYTLAEPSLTAISGQTATFLAGGELPIPMRSGSGGDTSTTVNFKRFGILLAMTPTVHDQNRLTVHLAPEVSEIDDSLSVTVSGLTVPGLRVRRTETTVSLGDGETFVISGLVSQQTASTIDKFPFLGDIPILGAFFKSSKFERNDRELLMIVTPHLVRPFSKEARLPALPGEELKDYDPGYLRFLFIENGKFQQPEAGFSR